MKLWLLAQQTSSKAFASCLNNLIQPDIVSKQQLNCKSGDKKQTATLNNKNNAT